MGATGIGRHQLAHYGIIEQWREYQRFRSDFIAVLDPELYNPEWLDMMLWSGQFRLFTSEKSAILTSIKVYPTGIKELHGEIATGNLGEIVRQLIPQAEAFARTQGCKIAVIQSREGWAKAMKRFGYNIHQTSIRKAL